jgi:hypothetical protein
MSAGDVDVRAGRRPDGCLTSSGWFARAALLVEGARSGDLRGAWAAHREATAEAERRANALESVHNPEARVPNRIPGQLVAAEWAAVARRA